jgi:4-hydroxy-3-methylbut-2-enyl diphosphate reductase
MPPRTARRPSATSAATSRCCWWSAHRTSSNSNRLREIGEECGIPSYLVADGHQVDPEWLAGKETIGITAGASAPNVLVDDVIGALAKLGPIEIKALQGVEEKITFRLPPELLKAS